MRTLLRDLRGGTLAERAQMGRELVRTGKRFEFAFIQFVETSANRLSHLLFFCLIGKATGRHEPNPFAAQLRLRHGIRRTE